MIPATEEELRSICNTFRDGWDATAPASISVFLDRAGCLESRDVLLAILDLDIQLRSQHRHSVSVEVYEREQWYAQYSSEVQERLSGLTIASEESGASMRDGSDFSFSSPPLDSAKRSIQSADLYGTRDAFATNDTDGPSQPVDAIGNYELLKRIGVGGMGEVYLACHCRFRDRQYAIKLIRGDYASPKAIDRFEREIDAMGHLSHPNLVFAVDAGRWRDQLYLVMQYVAGMDLQQLLSEHGPLPIDESCELIRQAAFGIAHAHHAGIVHRDIKPSNLMLSGSGELMVLDLGLAALERDGNHLTAEGAAIGTAAFMSPEQWQDSRLAGKPSDVYSLGCTLYSLLTGKPPFSWAGDKSLPALMKRHLDDEAVAASERRAEIPESLCKLISQTLQKSPDNRILIGELVSRLATYCEQGSLTQSLDVVNNHLQSQIANEQTSLRFAESGPAGSIRSRSTTPVRLVADATALELEEHRFVSEAHEMESSGGDTGKLQWSRNQTGAASKKLLFAIVSPLLIVGSLSLVMAYFGPDRTETWIQRFDRLDGRDVPAGTGFLIEWVRLILFVGSTCLIVGSRFTRSIQEFFNLRKWNLKVIASRAATLVLVGFFVSAESKRHLSLEMAPQNMVDWGLEHGITTTVIAESGPYAWYLPYSLISYTVVLGGLFAFPFIRFWLSDFSYMQRQADRFATIQARVKTSEIAMNNLHRFAHECHRLTKRYVDVLGVLCMGIQYEYWVGQFTLTGAGIQTAMMGWFAAAFALAFVIAISATYVRGYNLTDEIVAASGSLEDGVRLSTMSVGWFLKKTFLAQLGGLLILSLLLVGLHAVISK